MSVYIASPIAAVLFALAGCGDDSSASDAGASMGSDASCEVPNLPLDVDAGGLLDNCTIGGGGGSDGGDPQNGGGSDGGDPQNGDGSANGGTQDGGSAFQAGQCYVEFELGSTSWDSRNMSFSGPFANVNGSGEGVVLTIFPMNSAGMFTFTVGGAVEAYMGAGDYPAQFGGIVNGTPYTAPQQDNGDPERGTLTVDNVSQPASSSTQLVEGSFTGPTLKNDQTRVTASGTYRLPLTKVDQSGGSPTEILVSPGMWDEVCVN